jgi:phenylalanyl-tRNA synthetase beta chain
MKISYNWLNNYIGTTLAPEKISEILTSTGLEVEGIEKIEAIKGGLQGVVVGQVIQCEKHENADKLKVTLVDLGNGEPQQIVCGAPNVAAGQKVLVATVGTTLYPTPDEPLKIKAAKIRGIDSNGMICAEDELGIGASHAGIMVLPEDAKIGTDAAAFLELEDDYLIEIGLTPNRSDAMGHIGVARDLIAYLNFHEKNNLTLQLPASAEKTCSTEKHPVNIHVECLEGAPRYAGITIHGLRIAPSPAWLQKRLRTIGLTPINNVVDITNFICHELGTPLHAFDLRKVGDEIRVRRAHSGEKITTLDEQERTLDTDDLIIANKTEALCIAGVFGGLHSGVQQDTTSIFLEAAYFNPVSVRKTAKRHGMNTDASFRFERGVDPSMITYALNRAVDLILELAGGEIGMNPVDCYPQSIPPKSIVFRYSRCNSVIGQGIEKDDINSILQSLDFAIEKTEGDHLHLLAPTYRTDVTREIDVIEEVLRIYGFNQVELPRKLNMSLPQTVDNSGEIAQDKITAFLVGQGFYEMMNNSLTQSAYVEKFGSDVLQSEHNVRMLNPLSQELDTMRRTLLFQALESFVHNQNRQHGNVRLFEFGKTYHKYASGYTENKRLILLVSGQKAPEQWNTTKDEFSFYSIKGYASGIVERLGLLGLSSYQPLKKSILQDGLSISVTNKKVGEIGWISKPMAKYFGVKQSVFVVDFDWDALVELLKMNKVKFKELPKTFAVRRDFSLLLNEQTTFGEIEHLAHQTEKKLLRNINLFDVYEGKNLPEGKKSYAVSFTFQDDEQTLKDEQIDQTMQRIREKLEKELGAELR